MPAVPQLNAPKIRNWFYLVASYIEGEGVFNGFFEFVQGLDNSVDIPRRPGEMGVPVYRPDPLVDMAIKEP